MLTGTEQQADGHPKPVLTGTEQQADWRPKHVLTGMEQQADGRPCWQEWNNGLTDPQSPCWQEWNNRLTDAQSPCWQEWNNGLTDARADKNGRTAPTKGQERQRERHANGACRRNTYGGVQVDDYRKAHLSLLWVHHQQMRTKLARKGAAVRWGGGGGGGQRGAWGQLASFTTDPKTPHCQLDSAKLRATEGRR